MTNQKKTYFKTLRNDWKKAKAEAKKNGTQTRNEFIRIQIEKNGIDERKPNEYRTMKQWNNAGYTVKKGAKAEIKTIHWIKSIKDKDNLYPKAKAVFNKDQVFARIEK